LPKGLDHAAAVQSAGFAAARSSPCVWTFVRDLGERSAIKGLHPHALRHACAVELLKRTKNLRAVQQHLRHRDIQSTTVYARLMPAELAEAVSAFAA